VPENTAVVHAAPQCLSWYDQLKSVSFYFGYPSVGFPVPHLSLISASAKLLDMRLVDDPDTCRLLPGAVFYGYQGDTRPFRLPLRVTSVKCFPDAAAAYAYYAARDMQSSLFPRDWCYVDGVSVTTPRLAGAYFQSQCRARHARSAVRVLALQPLHVPAETRPPEGLPPPDPPFPPPRIGIPHIPVRPSTLPPWADIPPFVPLPPRSNSPALVAAAVVDAPAAPVVARDPRPLPVVPVVRPRSSPAPSLCPSRRLPPYAPLTHQATAAVRDVQVSLDPNLVERLVSDARCIARSRGGHSVTARDFYIASAKAQGLAEADSPAAEIPENYDEVVDTLASIRRGAQLQLGGALQGPSPRAPRVLVIGEVHGTIAGMFARAGADVATCDLKPSATADEIPHFQGDYVHIADLGWDLVIAHPPCTYLSNAGGMWLKRDPGRFEHVLSNVNTFRQMYSTRAPFVAVENTKMHRVARTMVGVSATQYVHPWQHGTGHTKATGLYLRNLPPIQPTCVVSGRLHAMARLPPSPDRSSARSRTYIGIAAAMAVQWMPVLLDYTSAFVDQPPDSRPSAASLVQQAQIAPTTLAQVVFVNRLTSTCSDSRVITDRTETMPAISLESSTSPTDAVKLWMTDDILLPSSWSAAVNEALRANPYGHRATTVAQSESRRVIYLWVIDVSHLDAGVMPLDRSTQQPVTYEWSRLDRARAWLGASLSESKFYRHFICSSHHSLVDLPQPRSAASVVVEGRELEHYPAPRLSSSAPWRIPHSDVPPPPPSPRFVRRLRGRWRAWTAGPVAPSGTRSFSWQPLPTELNQQLDAHLRPSLPGMPSVPEDCPASSQWSIHEAAAVSSAAPSRASFALEDLRAMWERRPPPPAYPYPGLGFDCSTPARPAPAATPPDANFSQYDVMARVRYYRDRHAAFQTSAPRLAAAVDFWSTTLIDDDSSSAARATLSADTDSSANTAEQPTASTLLGEVTEEDLALTPKSVQLDSHSLYIQNIRLLRYAQTRGHQHQTYEVSCAVGASPYALADTGAGPSIVTTGFLDQAPRDCVKSRNRSAEVGRILGADGQPLVTEGTISLAFDLDGHPCCHDFVVACGKPLILIGTDFLSPRKAVIHMNTNGQGDGHIDLESTTVHGRTVRHQVAVSTKPRSRIIASVYPSDQPPQPDADSRQSDTSGYPAGKGEYPTTADAAPSGSAPDQSDTSEYPADIDVQPPEPAHVPTSTPLPAAELAADALKDGSWKLERSEHLSYSNRSIELAPRAVTTTLFRAPQELRSKSVSCLLEPLPARPGLDEPPHALGGVVSIVEGFIEVRLVNRTDKRIFIPGHSPVALLDSEYWVRGNLNPDAVKPDGDVDHYLALSPEQRKLVDSISVDPDKRLSDVQRERVIQLVSKHIAAFAIDPKNPSKTHLLEVELPLKPGAIPHRHPPSRLGEEGRAIVEKHVEEMESRGIIRKSNSAWGSRVVLVSKKDGSVRFCVDYRDTNSKLLVQDSPLPLTVEAIDRLSSGSGNPDSLFLSTLDLASGFWCLPIKEEDKPITAFVTHRQKYEFNYLPFGIQSGPSYMCRLMDAALQGLAWETCMPYLDDVGTWSTGSGATLADREAASFEQHCQRLEAVFERLKWAGLSMKASKCILFATSAEYLGHVIGRHGLSMDPKKIAAVAAVDPTSINTVEKVRSFLGLCSYYRRFITGFSKIAAPLHNLTKDGVDIAVESQSEVCQTAIKALIKAITSEPVLATPRYDRPFIVKTDAANTEGLGGVLSQQDDEGRERVISYFSRKLIPAERHYTVTEIELLAAIEAIKQWRPYLWGRQFKLVIDHSALRWLHTMRDTMEGGPASRLMRWILKLQEYNFTVEHKPGVLHKDADGVSRLVCAATRVPHTYVAPVTRTAVHTARRQRAARRVATDRHDITTSYLDPGAPTIDTLLDEQLSDSTCAAIRSYLETGHAGDARDADELRQALWLAREVCPDASMTALLSSTVAACTWVLTTCYIAACPLIVPSRSFLNRSDPPFSSLITTTLVIRLRDASIQEHLRMRSRPMPRRSTASCPIRLPLQRCEAVSVPSVDLWQSRCAAAQYVRTARRPRARSAALLGFEPPRPRLSFRLGVCSPLLELLAGCQQRWFQLTERECRLLRVDDALGPRQVLFNIFDFSWHVCRSVHSLVEVLLPESRRLEGRFRCG
jgi:hypothetical protein